MRPAQPRASRNLSQRGEIATIFAVITLLITLLALPVSVKLVQENQDIREQAKQIDCQDDSECGANYRCVSNRCKPKPTPTPKTDTGGGSQTGGGDSSQQDQQQQDQQQNQQQKEVCNKDCVKNQSNCKAGSQVGGVGYGDCGAGEYCCKKKTTTTATPTPIATPTPTATPTSTPTTVTCGSQVGVQTISGKCVSCQYPYQSSPPLADADLCASQTGCINPAGKAGDTECLDNNTAKGKCVSYLGGYRWDKTACQYGCQEVTGVTACKPAPVGTTETGCLNPAGTIGEVKCNTAGNLSQCVNREGAVVWYQTKTCPAGCKNGACLVPTPTPTPTPKPTPTPTPVSTAAVCTNPSAPLGTTRCADKNILSTCTSAYGSTFWYGQSCTYGCEIEGGVASCQLLGESAGATGVRGIGESCAVLDCATGLSCTGPNETCVVRLGGPCRSDSECGLCTTGGKSRQCVSGACTLVPNQTCAAQETIANTASIGIVALDAVALAVPLVPLGSQGLLAPVVLFTIQERDAIVAQIEMVTSPGIYVPALGKFVVARGGFFYDAQTGSLLGTLEELSSLMYLSNPVIRGELAQYVAVTPSTFTSSSWERLEANVAALSPENDLSKITDAIHQNISYQSEIAAAYAAAQTKGEIQPGPFDALLPTLEYQLSSRKLEDVISQDQAVCFDFAVTEHLILAERGIASQIVSSPELDHVFLLVEQNGETLVVDPTWNVVIPLSEHPELTKAVLGIEEYTLEDVASPLTTLGQ